MLDRPDFPPGSYVSPIYPEKNPEHFYKVVSDGAGIVVLLNERADVTFFEPSEHFEPHLGPPARRRRLHFWNSVVARMNPFRRLAI